MCRIVQRKSILRYSMATALTYKLILARVINRRIGDVVWVKYCVFDSIVTQND